MTAGPRAQRLQLWAPGRVLPTCAGGHTCGLPPRVWTGLAPSGRRGCACHGELGQLSYAHSPAVGGGRGARPGPPCGRGSRAGAGAGSPGLAPCARLPPSAGPLPLPSVHGLGARDARPAPGPSVPTFPGPWTLGTVAASSAQGAEGTLPDFRGWSQRPPPGNAAGAGGRVSGPSQPEGGSSCCHRPQTPCQGPRRRTPTQTTVFADCSC